MSDGIADASGSKPSPSRNHVHYVTGSTGVGKSFAACALAQKACRDGYSALYTRTAALFRELAMARADGSLRNWLAKLSRIDVRVNPGRMRANLDDTKGAVFAEKAVMLLAPEMGKQSARQKVEEAIRGTGMPPALPGLDVPEDYLGSAEAFRLRLLGGDR